MTFLLVATVYAAAVAKPGHGNTAPLAIGLSLYAAALTGELLWQQPAHVDLGMVANSQTVYAHNALLLLQLQSLQIPIWMGSAIGLERAIATCHCVGNQGQHLAMYPLLNWHAALRVCRWPIHWRQPEPCPHHRPLCGVCLQRRHFLLLHLCGVLWWCAGCWHGHLPIWPCTCGPRSARQGWGRHELSSRAAERLQLMTTCHHLWQRHCNSKEYVCGAFKP
jgi:hypothetical protein